MSMPCQSHVGDVSEKRKKKRYRLDTAVQRVLPVLVICQNGVSVQLSHLGECLDTICYWKHCNKIIFKYVNSIVCVRPNFKVRFTFFILAGLVNRARDSTKKRRCQTQHKRYAIQTHASFLEITFLKIMDESKKMLKLLLFSMTKVVNWRRSIVMNVISIFQQQNLKKCLN